jgi:hypothetical protein
METDSPLTPAAPSGALPSAAAALAVGAAAALLLYRNGPVLGFDAYYYCEFAKRYAAAWPASFGNSWPCGYPLLAGLLGRIGVPAYAALCAISLASLASLAATGAVLLGRSALTTLVLAALATAPEIGVQLFGALSELPFAAALLGLAASLARWRRGRGFRSAAALALLALCLRYAGVLAFAALWAWLLLNARELARGGSLGRAIRAAAAASAAAGLLLLWNLLATGRITSPDHNVGAGADLALLPAHAADLGWSLPAALMLGGIRARAGGAGGAIGGLLCLGAVVLCVRALARPRADWERPVAFVALAYGAGLVLLRSVATFDDLDAARVAVPGIFPLGILAAGRLRGRSPRLVAVGAAALLALGCLGAARGVSRQIGGDVRPAAAVLEGRIPEGAGVQVNDHALSLSAYLPCRTIKATPGGWTDDPGAPFLVVAANPADRRGDPGPLDPGWLALARALAESGSYRFLLDTPGLIVLERTRHGPRLDHRSQL